jgi:phospholipid-binding lipoprotein MlaA
MNKEIGISALKGAALLASLLLQGGCATNPTAAENNDPLEPTNRSIYGFNDSLDRNVLVPVAEAYKTVTPVGFRNGVSNFFSNFNYLNVILNDLLQGKLLQGLQDSGRVVINTTLGFGGFFDVATPMGFEKHDEDFGQTLGVWGAGENNYLMLPLMGPSSGRDLPGLATSTLLNPLFYIGGLVTVPVGFLNVVNERASLLEATRVRDEAALDPYTFTREAYRQRREFQISDGQGTFDAEGLYEDFDSESTGTGATSTAAPTGTGGSSTEGGGDVLKID